MNSFWRYFTIAMAVLVLSCTVCAETIQKPGRKARHHQGGGRMITLALQYPEAKFLSADSALQPKRESSAFTSAEGHFPHRDAALPGEPRAVPPGAGIHVSGSLVGVFWNLGNNVKLGAGYSFSPLSDDLAEVALDRGGPFISFVGSL